MALAVFAAMALAGGIILAIEYLDNTIKSSEDVENRLGLTVLGTIPEFRIK
jgi:capsular polysaccharide biosynthesis protein